MEKSLVFRAAYTLTYTNVALQNKAVKTIQSVYGQRHKYPYCIELLHALDMKVIFGKLTQYN